MLEQMDDITDQALDALVDSIAQPIIDAIDCTQCANCCQSLRVYLTRPDIQVLLQYLTDKESAASEDELMEQYVELDPTGEELGWFKARPCAFLKGKLCSVYAHRPESCRIYPVFTPDFRWTLSDLIDGAGLCPIIYNVLDAMVDETEALSKRGTTGH